MMDKSSVDIKSASEALLSLSDETQDKKEDYKVRETLPKLGELINDMPRIIQRLDEGRGDSSYNPHKNSEDAHLVLESCKKNHMMESSTNFTSLTSKYFRFGIADPSPTLTEWNSWAPHLIKFSDTQRPPHFQQNGMHITIPSEYMYEGSGYHPAGGRPPHIAERVVPHPRYVQPYYWVDGAKRCISPSIDVLNTSRVVEDHSSGDEGANKKRRKEFPWSSVKEVRPKVVVEKGAVQCIGTNRKKGLQCRNAALKEYIGPRPSYCAEHIELDPQSLYKKCTSPYQKEPGDKKGCKEVVLKEFGVCHKHFADLSETMIKDKDIERVRYLSGRITQIHLQLDTEAAAAKQIDMDLYQRKIKLLPKFSEMKVMVTKALEKLEKEGLDVKREAGELTEGERRETVTQENVDGEDKNECLCSKSIDISASESRNPLFIPHLSAHVDHMQHVLLPGISADFWFYASFQHLSLSCLFSAFIRSPHHEETTQHNHTTHAQHHRSIYT
ncbi:hypothetical protein PROFUN_09150 [Planoprotostelium fungivorum]|uniref:Potential DNA-binding domain-containing protein n=1 Tax=Planoprotostelium fungivorum TaxID=1890364 RepID=A0A2P6MVQ2_9EUKA|nr:hypothetical protein PROFUN_09150 [Planoprotostelium fungivorum]